MPAVSSKKTYIHKIFFRWGPALFMMGLIFTVSSFPSSSIPNYGGFDFLVKKSGHFLGYTALALAYHHALNVKGFRRGWFAWILAVLFAISDEFHQSFVPGRTPWAVDILIDSIGAFVGCLVWQVIHRRKG